MICDWKHPFVSNTHMSFTFECCLTYGPKGGVLTVRAVAKPLWFDKHVHVIFTSWSHRIPDTGREPTNSIIANTKFPTRGRGYLEKDQRKETIMVQVFGLRHCFQKFMPWLTSNCNCGKWPWVIWQFDVWKLSMDTQDKVSEPRADFRVKEKEGRQGIMGKHTGPRRVRILLRKYDNEWGKSHHAASFQNPNEAK